MTKFVRQFSKERDWTQPGAVALLLAIALCLLPRPTTAQSVSEPSIAQAISKLLGPNDNTANAARTIVATDGIPQAYRTRQFEPIWLDKAGLNSRGHALFSVLSDAAREGLEPSDYLSRTGAGSFSSTATDDMARLDLMLSSTLLRYVRDLRTGRPTPRQVDPELFASVRPLDLSGLLSEAAGRTDIAAYLRRYVPASPPYRRLRRALASYRELARTGGWASIAPGPVLKRGMQGDRVAALRRRLIAGGDLSNFHEATDDFDSALELALRQFQRRHLLEPDGVAGPQTLSALNVTVEERIRQIIVNMERWRWMPNDLGDLYVLVNMAAFELDVVELGQSVLSMRVVVGRPYRRTPVFSDRIRYLEFNPVWHVPPRIASKDLLPKQIADPSFLQNNRFRVMSDWSDKARELDPASIDWRQYRDRNLPFKLRQDAGPGNALGRVKFMFPNEHDVYLHDTASPELFRKLVRTFSSGCIRVEQPRALATLLLQGTPGWGEAAVDAAMKGDKTQVARLAEPIPVHLTYSTVWIGEGGTIHFAKDVYNRDQALYEAIFP